MVNLLVAFLFAVLFIALCLAWGLLLVVAIKSMFEGIE